MPEQITKYPEVTLTVLKSAGAVCGEGKPQKILTQCPTEHFCSLPGGELCVYGLDQISNMTQVTVQEVKDALNSDPPRAAAAKEISPMEGLAVAVVFVAGIILGRVWPRVRP